MQRTCANSWCRQFFEITDDDLKFYENVSPIFGGKKYVIPPPDTCPQCRFRQRLQWRPESHLFKRRSDFSGKQILSFLPADAPCKVISPEEWWSESWNPLEYGQEIDFKRPFFEQFGDLLRNVPMISLSIGGQNENSDYLNSASWLKNCYLIAGANHDEDCYYGNFVNYCKSCVDCNFVDHCELLYDCIDCTHCYNLRYSQQCSNCSDSAFLFACRGCQNCFGCVNAVNKQCMFLNEQLSKEEYGRRVNALSLHSRKHTQEAMLFFLAHRLKFPHKYMMGEMNENVTGDGILRSKNAFECFDVSDAEDIKYCGWFHQAKNCMDCYAWGLPAENSYFNTECGDRGNHVLFSVLTYNGSDVFYSVHIRSCKQVFGCISLRHTEYCILNKQYTEEEYHRLSALLSEHMHATGEWGKFFPALVCPFAYNQTIAQDYFPITREEADNMGVRWGEDLEQHVLPTQTAVPDSIRDVDESICEEVFSCAETGLPFKITPQEFKFYKSNDLPLPDKAFFTRHLSRLRRRNPKKLWNRECAKCHEPIATSYSPERPEIVYCEECYLKEVY
ncbi:MAG: hypothetical protein V1926_03565 [Candidatus Peregrinibacteria bacterium]